MTRYPASGVTDLAFDNHVSRDARDSVATNLLRELTPGIDSLVHDAIVLAVSALSSGALATLAEVDDGVLGSVHGVDLDLVVAVLDGLDGHRVSLVWYVPIIMPPPQCDRGSVPAYEPNTGITSMHVIAGSLARFSIMCRASSKL